MPHSSLTPPPAPLRRLLEQSSRILAVAHKDPDGDAIGSIAAFAHMLLAQGKDVRLFCETILPDHFAWLPLPAPLVRSFAELGDWRPDLVAALDCADEDRTGREMAAFIRTREAGTPLICIDHHIGNPLFADANWVNTAYCATGAMIGELARHCGIPLKGSFGEALYLALVSDTGSFTYSNTNAHALGMAAEIVENGLSLAAFTEQYENIWSISRMHLWGQLMHEVRLECDGAVAVSVVTSKRLQSYGLTFSALENFASWLRRLKGVKIVLFAYSSKHGTKISLRSTGGVNVQAIAARFGGGGHIAAAGVNMKGEPGPNAEIVLQAVKETLGAAG